MKFLLVVAMASLALARVDWQTLHEGFGEDISLKEVPVSWFEQRLDHFDAQNTDSWQQRYWDNKAYQDGSNNAPVIIYICGEGTCSAPKETSFTINLAKYIKA